MGKVRWLQSALTVMNHNPGPIDGAMGPSTMQAVASWRNVHASARTGPLTAGEFKQIVEEFGRLFEQVQALTDQTVDQPAAGPAPR